LEALVRFRTISW